MMMRATQKEQATTSLKTNSMNVNRVEYKQGFKNDLERNLSQQLRLVEIRKMVSVDPAWTILTCASQNMDGEISKLDAAKIVHKHIHS